MSVFWFFISNPIGRWIAGAVIALVALGSTYGYLRVHYYNEGFAAALHAIAAQDKKAIDAAQRAKEAVRACRESGGTWDIDGGLCRK